MKGSDKIVMTINIGGELIDLDTKFDEQNEVRDAEREVKLYIEKMRKQWHVSSDRKLLAMAAYQFAKWYHQLLKIQQEAIEMANLKCQEIKNLENTQEDISNQLAF